MWDRHLCLYLERKQLLLVKPLLVKLQVQTLCWIVDQLKCVSVGAFPSTCFNAHFQLAHEN